MNVKKNKWIEAVAITIIFVLVLAVQLMQISRYQGFFEENSLLMNAFINQGNSSIDISLGGEFFYTNLLSLICSLFGNIPSVLYYLQGFLQFLIVFFVFFALRKVFNSITAFFYVVLFLCIPLNIDLSNEVFVLLVFSFLVWLLCSLFQFCIEENKGYIDKLILASMVGFLCGICVGADVIVIVLILIGLIGLLILEEIDGKVILAYGLGTLFGALIVVVVNIVATGKGLIEVIMDYGLLYFSQVDITGFQNTIFYDSWNVYYIIGTGIAFIVVYTYGWIYGKKAIAFLFSLSTVVVICFISFNIGVIAYDRILLVVMSFLFCNGIYGILHTYKYKEKAEKNIKSQEILEQKVEVVKPQVIIEAKPEPKVEVAKSQVIIEEKLEPKVEVAKPQVIIEVKPEPKVERKSKINFIPNPLPVPKKHRKKILQYGFEPKQDQMKFDIELDKTNDDYDIT